MDWNAVAEERVKVAKALVGVGGPIDAGEVVKILKDEKGQPFKANWTGAWDRATAGNARLVTVNRGGGFEKAAAVDAEGGTMVYMGPFSVEAMPTGQDMFLFYCDDGLFLKGL